MRRFAVFTSDKFPFNQHVAQIGPVILSALDTYRFGLQDVLFVGNRALVLLDLQINFSMLDQLEQYISNEMGGGHGQKTRDKVLV